MTGVHSTEQQLSPYFMLSEFIRSATANRLGVDNSPPAEVRSNLEQLARYCEQVRAELGNTPMIISSGYRCPDLNRAVSGSPNSRHMVGLACDFTAPHFGTPFAICKKLTHPSIAFDQLILEYSARANWVHLGIATRDEIPRRQVLTINSKGTRVGLWAP